MLRLGILGCADIAFKRFMPAIEHMEEIKVIVVGEEYAPEKLEMFCEIYGIEGEKSFEKILERDDVDAVYIPQPPALHYFWAKKALEAGKHVLVEKPSTVSLENTKELIELAQKKNLALFENYMFQYHSQIQKLKEILQEESLGDLRGIRLTFGFPKRAENDFRYNRQLGGGALWDAGGYTVKLATILLGNEIKIDSARLRYLPGYDVDMYGAATISNPDGDVCQIGFGMDCAYQCSVEIWGSQGRLFSNRIFTAPDGYTPVFKIEINGKKETLELEPDSHFSKSVRQFLLCIQDENRRIEEYSAILLQSQLVNSIIEMSDGYREK